MRIGSLTVLELVFIKYREKKKRKGLLKCVFFFFWVFLCYKVW